ncbi:MAG: thioredoxin reductase [Psychrobacter glaciei]|jgi:thioredoxin reductase
MIKNYDHIIIGGGPAGLQLGYLLKKSGRSYLIIERGDSPGTFFKEFPIHKKLISANKVYTGYEDPERNLRWDWNSLISDDESLLFKNYSKDFFPSSDEMVKYLADFASIHELNIIYQEEVKNISKPNIFKIDCKSGLQFESNQLVIATGVSEPYIPDIKGIENAELYADVSLDANEYTDQRVLIIGKGNSAFETADSIISTASRIYVCSPTPITLSWKSKFVGHLRAINNNFIDTYQLKLQNVMLDAHVVGLEKKGNIFIVKFHYVHADDEIEEMEFDRVILCTGFKFNVDIFSDNCKPELKINNRFPAQKSSFESINIPDLFFAGTIMQERDFKQKQSGFVHGFRHNIQGLHHILEEKYHATHWPKDVLNSLPFDLAKSILERSNISPGLWQQSGFICDVIVKEVNETYGYYKDVPIQYVNDSYFGEADEYHLLTLEFGLEIIFASKDPLAVDRVHKDDYQNANLSTGIHPIIRSYSKGEFISEHHVVEDIIPEWNEYKTHIKPLEEYFEKFCIAEISTSININKAKSVA